MSSLFSNKKVLKLDAKSTNNKRKTNYKSEVKIRNICSSKQNENASPPPKKKKKNLKQINNS